MSPKHFRMVAAELLLLMLVIVLFLFAIIAVLAVAWKECMVGAASFDRENSCH